MDITKMLSGVRIDPKASAPIYLQIANSLAAKIKECTLPVGTKLLPERELASLLEVSRTTIINAYRLLEERGLVSTRIGSGTYVANLNVTDQQANDMPWEQLFSPHYKSPLSSLLRSLVATPTADETISFAAGMPDPALYDLKIIEKALVDGNHGLDAADFGYIPIEGYPPFRRSLATWQNSQGIHAAPDNILIVSGSQQGLYLIVKAFVEPRDYVIVESPTYLGAIQVLEAAGARVLCLPQSSSLDLGALEDYLIRYRPKLFYTIPTFQNPTGQVMPLHHRQELIRLAARYRLAIVEDDPYSQLYYGQQPPPSLKSLDTYGGVIYLGTFSKILFPGLRTGWVTAAPQVINRLAQEKQYVDLHSNNLSQIILHTCLADHYLADHLSFVRREYKKRRDTLAGAIRQYCSTHLDFELPEGGFYLWCNVRPPASPVELLRRSAAAGVTFVPGEAFYLNNTESHHIRLCFATLGEDRLNEGIRRLAKIFKSGTANATFPSGTAGRPLI
ncbi:GntR family transcriptional regulator [Anaerosporomusa subterranea]|uniref:GntR family transcriptional regulator n=1 Tax=Anaerosporomusa subterranea TaxID=1794912 RepID=A0A154BLF8_ANASB|nr:PLP-dependent aminotransferase family protein [Anaerosporomusa subterranea]KYZ74817.1 GntR family transcriptional regulator [Anaerosporomusa subterranea]